jgi:hypothetical protein
VGHNNLSLLIPHFSGKKRKGKTNWINKDGIGPRQLGAVNAGQCKIVVVVGQ